MSYKQNNNQSIVVFHFVEKWKRNITKNIDIIIPHSFNLNTYHGKIIEIIENTSDQKQHKFPFN